MLKKQIFLTLIFGFTSYILSEKIIDTPESPENIVNAIAVEIGEPQESRPANTTGITFKMDLNSVQEFLASLPTSKLNNTLVMYWYKDESFVKKIGGSSFDLTCDMNEITDAIERGDFKKPKKPSDNKNDYAISRKNTKRVSAILKKTRDQNNLVNCVHCTIKPEKIDWKKTFGLNTENVSDLIILGSEDTDICTNAEKSFDQEIWFHGLGRYSLHPEQTSDEEE